jgi:transcriptional regulator with XRE-family HTH domain
MDLEEAIRKINKATGLTQEEIADKIGYSRSHLSVSIKTGGSKKLINALKSEFKDLIGHEQIAPETTYIKEVEGGTFMGEREERIIRLESYSVVILKVLSDLIADKTGRQSSLIEAELQEAISKVSELGINALQRKS